MKTSRYLISATFVALLGCASVVPDELVKARSAYQLASQGPAQQLVPADLHKAHEALNQAEQSFQEDPDSFKTKDLAYVAQRKSEQAGALGSMAAAKASKDSANADFQLKQSEIVQQGKQDLRDSEKRTASARAEIDRQAALKAAKDQADADYQRQQVKIDQGKQELRDTEKRAALTQAALEKQAALTRADLEKQAALTRADLEKQAAVKAVNDQAAVDLQNKQAEILQAKLDLEDSEKRSSDALASLAALAMLKEEERGLVVTLSGSVLFQSAKSDLMPSAQVKLDQVTQALLAIPARNLIVEGHTDSQGSDAFNQGLSQHRADAVRDYLVRKGYPADRVQARGRGEGSPIAKNDSAEGRANNRRVEIVIERVKTVDVKK